MGGFHREDACSEIKVKRWNIFQSSNAFNMFHFHQCGFVIFKHRIFFNVFQTQKWVFSTACRSKYRIAFHYNFVLQSHCFHPPLPSSCHTFNLHYWIVKIKTAPTGSVIFKDKGRSKFHSHLFLLPLENLEDWVQVHLMSINNRLKQN